MNKYYVCFPLFIADLVPLYGEAARRGKRAAKLPETRNATAEIAEYKSR